MRTCGPGRVPRGAARRTVPVQALREPAVGGTVRPRLDRLARRGAGGRAASQRILRRGMTAPAFAALAALALAPAPARRPARSRGRTPFLARPAPPTPR